MLEQLPIGRSGFPALRKNGAVYVDKTRFICGIAEEHGRNFLDNPKTGFLPYWWLTGGGPAQLLKLLSGSGAVDPASYGALRRTTREVLRAGRCGDDLDAAALLFQTGYLALEKVVNQNFILDYPNKEVAGEAARCCADAFLKRPAEAWKKLEQTASALATGSLEEVVQLFNAVLEEVDWERISAADARAARGCLGVLLVAAASETRVEVLRGSGEGMRVAAAGGRRWEFGFEQTEAPSAAAAKLVRSAERMRLEDVDSGAEQGVAEGVIRAALVFDGSARRFTQFALVP